MTPLARVCSAAAAQGPNGIANSPAASVPSAVKPSGESGSISPRARAARGHSSCGVAASAGMCIRHLRRCRWNLYGCIVSASTCIRRATTACGHWNSKSSTYTHTNNSCHWAVMRWSRLALVSRMPITRQNTGCPSNPPCSRLPYTTRQCHPPPSASCSHNFNCKAIHCTASKGPRIGTVAVTALMASIHCTEPNAFCKSS